VPWYRRQPATLIPCVSTRSLTKPCSGPVSHADRALKATATHGTSGSDRTGRYLDTTRADGHPREAKPHTRRPILSECPDGNVTKTFPQYKTQSPRRACLTKDQDDKIGKTRNAVQPTASLSSIHGSMARTQGAFTGMDTDLKLRCHDSFRTGSGNRRTRLRAPPLHGLLSAHPCTQR
jgi:hypothetical protein